MATVIFCEMQNYLVFDIAPIARFVMHCLNDVSGTFTLTGPSAPPTTPLASTVSVILPTLGHIQFELTLGHLRYQRWDTSNSSLPWDTCVIKGGTHPIGAYLGTPALSELGKTKRASSTLRASQAVPHPSTDRALQRLTSEFGRDPVYSLRYGR